MSIIEASLELLQPGWMWEQFNTGAYAIRLEVASSVRMMWKKLVEDQAEVLPWEAPLADIAANHCGNQEITKSIGDVFFFQPGNHGYIGRKLVISEDKEGELRVRPPTFKQGGERIEPSSAAIEEAYQLARAIMTSMAPADRDPKSFDVCLQRLKYQHDRDEFEGLAGLTFNSLGRWGRLASRIDRNRGQLNHRLSGRKVSDVLGLAMEIPGSGALVRKMSAKLDRKDSAGGVTVIERAHFDERYFSALCGTRQSVQTEAFVNGEWQPLPIDLDHLLILPGSIAARKFGLPRILHRVVYPETGERFDINPRCGNVTLLIGAV